MGRILELYRPVPDLNEKTAAVVEAAVVSRGVASKTLKIFGHTASKAVILGYSDLNTFLDFIQFNPKTVDADELGDYLEAHMPPSTDRHLTVPSLPFGEYTPIDRTKVRLFTLGTDNPTIREERAAAIKLTEEYFGVDEEDTTGAWLDWDYMAEIWIARSSNPETIVALRDLLTQEPQLLPSHFVLEPVAMNTMEPI